MKKKYTHLPRVKKAKPKRLKRIAGTVLSPIYWTAACLCRTPGLFVHWHLIILALRTIFTQKNTNVLIRYILFPMDSIRYFEFAAFWKSFICDPSVESYLDVSSPRLFPAMLLSKYPRLKATLVNPDSNDLLMTRTLMNALGFANRCALYCRRVDELDISQSYDRISSISVIEHIPEGGDRRAVEKMWSLLKIGGRLLLSVPCAREAFQEYMDYDEYGLLAADRNGFIYSQQFYDAALLKDRIFAITGNPFRLTVFGEKEPGTFARNRAIKVSDPDYPFWREPLITVRDYRYYDSISDLPGWGVVSMEFIKR